MSTRKVTQCYGVTSHARRCQRMADWGYVDGDFRIVGALCSQHDSSARGHMLSRPYPWDYALRVDLRTNPHRAARERYAPR